MKEFIENIKVGLKSIRVKLFLTLSLTILLIIIVLVILNNTVLETFYTYSKQKELKSVYQMVNEYYKRTENDFDLEAELERIAIRNDFDIVLRGTSDELIYTKRII